MQFAREGIFGVVKWVQGLMHAQSGKSGVTYAGQNIHMQDNMLTSTRLRLDDLITASTKQTPHPTSIGLYTTPRHASHHYGC